MLFRSCPAGWRVPEGGDNGVWAKALGKTEDVNMPPDETNGGINYTGAFGDDEIIWYPGSGYRYYYYGDHRDVGRGYYWSFSPGGMYHDYAYNLRFSYYGGGDVAPSSSNNRACGCPVRCLKEE